MKRLFPFFFLLIMALNVALPFVEQAAGSEFYELAKMGADDEGKAEKEKESEKEKETLSFSEHTHLYIEASGLENFKKSLFSANDFPVSELYASLPELPPDA